MESDFGAGFECDGGHRLQRCIEVVGIPKDRRSQLAIIRVATECKSTDKYSGFWESMICHIVRTTPIEH